MSKKKNVVLMAWGGAKETAQQVSEFNKYTGFECTCLFYKF